LSAIVQPAVAPETESCDESGVGQMHISMCDRGFDNKESLDESPQGLARRLRKNLGIINRGHELASIDAHS
jgi:hypothetical protein